MKEKLLAAYDTANAWEIRIELKALHLVGIFAVLLVLVIL